MEEDKVVMIPFVAHESSMNRMEKDLDRMERANRRLWIAILVMFTLFMTYLFLPVEVSEDSEQNIQDVENSEVHQNIGD